MFKPKCGMKFDKPEKKVAVKISLTINWFLSHIWMRSAERLFACEWGHITSIRAMAFETNNAISRYPPVSQVVRTSVLFHLRNG
jgi:hypothetical protein